MMVMLSMMIMIIMMIMLIMMSTMWLWSWQCWGWLGLTRLNCPEDSEKRTTPDPTDCSRSYMLLPFPRSILPSTVIMTSTPLLHANAIFLINIVINVNVFIILVVLKITVCHQNHWDLMSSGSWVVSKGELHWKNVDRAFITFTGSYLQSKMRKFRSMVKNLNITYICECNIIANHHVWWRKMFATC